MEASKLQKLNKPKIRSKIAGFELIFKSQVFKIKQKNNEIRGLFLINQRYESE